MKILVGLGNPGAEYENTYHNVGRMALGVRAQDLASHKGLFVYEKSGGRAIVIPLTYMNESGAAVREAAKKFKASPEDIIVLHDESDLPVGSYRISVGRSAAGHRGVQSIMDALGTTAFTRVRIGIRDPREKTRKKASAFVLKTISVRDKRALKEVFEKIEAEPLLAV